MAVHWGSVTNNTSQYGAYINMYEIANSVNVAENTSKVGVEFHITRSNWGWQTSNSYSGSITINGVSQSFSYSPNWAYSSSGDVTIAYFETTVKHNDDGSKWCDASANWWTSGTYSCGTASASGGITLTKIPRASGIACSSPKIGDAITITIDKKSPNFTNTITYNIGGLTGTIATKTSAETINFPTTDIADQVYALIPNSKQIDCVAYCTTYDGNTQIGSTTSATFKLYANEEDVKPDVSGTIVDTNATTIALTGSSSIIVKYASRPKVTVNATAKKSATIKSYSINANDGQQVFLQEYTFTNGIASEEVTINATDSRGFDNPLNLKPTIIDYIPVIISAFQGQRTEDVSNEVILNASGVWFNGKFSANKSNSLTCRFWYRESGQPDWVDGGIITPTIEGNTFEFKDFSLGNIYDYQKQWQFKLRVQDLTGYTERDDLNISKGQEVVAIGDDKVWVNGELEVDGDLNVVGDIKLDSKSLKAVTLYENNNGATGTITLSDSAANYALIEIFYIVYEGYVTSARIPNPNGKVASLFGSAANTSDVATYLRASNARISGTSITLEHQMQSWIRGTGCQAVGLANAIRITKVVGYKDTLSINYTTKIIDETYQEELVYNSKIYSQKSANVDLTKYRRLIINYAIYDSNDSNNNGGANHVCIMDLTNPPYAGWYTTTVVLPYIVNGSVQSLNTDAFIARFWVNPTKTAIGFDAWYKGLLASSATQYYISSVIGIK